MKVILQINSGIVGSTGNIMKNINKLALENGFKSFVSSPRDFSQINNYPNNHKCIGTIIEKKFHRFMGKYTGNEGGYSKFATKRFLKWVDKINPDIIHIHNLHLNYINIEMLFNYLKKNSNINVILTLHDCWTFTGHCPHYEMICCNKWKETCYECKVYNSYPVSRKDNSLKMHKRKKEWFLGIKNMTLVAPSKWMKKQIKESFLREYDTRVIYNGIDLNVFKPVISNMRNQLNLQDKKIILGVAFSWSNKKGLDVFLQLDKLLDNSFQIVLIGLSEKNIKDISNTNIIGIERTGSLNELAKYYTIADVYVNPTREETMGLTNIEALACGTPVITFNSGGSPECIDEKSGFIVEKNNILELIEKIKLVCEHDIFDKDRCIKRASKFDKNDKLLEYIDLYKQVLN